MSVISFKHLVQWFSPQAYAVESDAGLGWSIYDGDEAGMNRLGHDDIYESLAWQSAWFGLIERIKEGVVDIAPADFFSLVNSAASNELIDVIKHGDGTLTVKGTRYRITPSVPTTEGSSPTQSA